MAGKFFVYELVDPRDNAVFYVGKGQGDRPLQHMKEARAGVNSAKCRKIREIFFADGEPTVRIVKYFHDEAKAFSFEIKQIKLYGLSTLTNIRPGGPEDWHEKSDKDKGLLREILRGYEKTGGFQPGYGFRFCGKWFELPDNWYLAMCGHMRDIIARRGIKWASRVSKVDPSTLDSVANSYG